MKSWQTILINMGLGAGAILVQQHVPDATLQTSLQGVILALMAAITRKAATSNPDGTPAQTAWQKETK